MSTSNTNNSIQKPIKPPPKPGQVKVYRALYDYSAQRPDELSFKENDIIYVLDMLSDLNWWKAKVGNDIGLIPANYIEESAETFINPMHDAAKRGNCDFLKECLDNKVSVNGLDKAGNTSLHWAAYGGHLDCLNLLLNEPNIILNVQNKLGDTPLHNAAIKNHLDIVEKLIEKGARVDILNKDNKAPFDLAIDAKCKSILQYNVNKEELISRNSEYLDENSDESD